MVTNQGEMFMIKKFDINQVINSVKSMINPESNTPNPQAGDQLGQKMADLSMLLQQLEKQLSSVSSDLVKANQMVNEIFAGVKILHSFGGTGADVQTTVAKGAKDSSANATDEGMPENPQAKSEDKDSSEKK